MVQIIARAYCLPNLFSNLKKQAGAELGQAQPKLGLKVGVCILGWRLKYEVEF